MILSLTGSEFDEEEAGSGNEDSDDSWTTQDEFTSQIILRCVSTFIIFQQCIHAERCLVKICSQNIQWRQNSFHCEQLEFPIPSEKTMILFSV